jgi:hypothetical protein
MRSHRGDLRLSNPDWNEYELLGAIRWLRAMLGRFVRRSARGQRGLMPQLRIVRTRSATCAARSK